MKEDEIDDICSTHGKIKKFIQNLKRKFRVIYDWTKTLFILLYFSGCDTLCSHRWVPTFWRNIVSPSSG
jgi:hypothetical protein